MPNFAKEDWSSGNANWFLRLAPEYGDDHHVVWHFSFNRRAAEQMARNLQHAWDTNPTRQWPVTFKVVESSVHDFHGFYDVVVHDQSGLYEADSLTPFVLDAMGRVMSSFVVEVLQ